MTTLAGAERHGSAARTYDAIMKVHLRPGPAMVTLGLLGVLGTVCAALIRQPDAEAQIRPPESEASIDSAENQSGKMATAEQEIGERIAALRTLEKQLRSATARQIVGLYRQLHARLLEPFGLTDSENEIALATIDGASNADIAAHVHLSESTVKHRLTSVFKKTHTASRHELRSKMLERLRLATEDPRD